MKSKTKISFVIASVGVLFAVNSVKAAGLNGEEAFANSLAPSALNQIELPKSALPTQPSALPDSGDIFLNFSECRIVDAKFKKQPPINESIEMLSGCMKQMSRQYKAQVKATMLRYPSFGPGAGPQGGSPWSIKLLVSGNLPAGNRLLSDLSYSLEKRNHQLFGYPATAESVSVVWGRP